MKKKVEEGARLLREEDPEAVRAERDEGCTPTLACLPLI